MKIIYIMGKSAVGKDTIFNIIKEKISITPYVLYTTRPKRTGEKNGVDYNFLTNEEMTQYIKENNSKVIEYRSYNTIEGVWKYATLLDYQFEKNQDLLMIGTLESFKSIKDYFEGNSDVKVIPIYIEVDDGIRLERALKREREQKNPKYEEMCRRFLADCADFSDKKIAECGIKKRFDCQNKDKCIEEIINYLDEQ